MLPQTHIIFTVSEILTTILLSLFEGQLLIPSWGLKRWAQRNIHQLANSKTEARPMSYLPHWLTQIQFCLFYNFQKKNTFSNLAEPSQAGSISVFGAIAGAQHYSEVMGFNWSSTHCKSSPPPSSDTRDTAVSTQSCSWTSRPSVT